MCFRLSILLSAISHSKHGRNLVGDTGDVSPTFSGEGNITCHVPSHFYLRALCLEVSKLNVKVVTFCVKSFHVRCYTQPWAQFGGGHGGRLPSLFQTGGHNMPCASHVFLFKFCICRGFKNKSDVCHVLCDELFMLDGRPHIAMLMLKQSLVRLKQSFTDSVSLEILASIKYFLAFFKFLETVKDV